MSAKFALVCFGTNLFSTLIKLFYIVLVCKSYLLEILNTILNEASKPEKNLLAPEQEYFSVLALPTLASKPCFYIF